MNAFWHLIHAILTLIFFPWALVWLCCAVSAGNKRKRQQDMKRDEELHLLRIIANQTKGEK